MSSHIDATCNNHVDFGQARQSCQRIKDQEGNVKLILCAMRNVRISLKVRFFIAVYPPPVRDPTLIYTHGQKCAPGLANVNFFIRFFSFLQHSRDLVPLAKSFAAFAS